jgi:heme/copper-type cytochrome/quinol oxidase subunit 2
MIIDILFCFYLICDAPEAWQAGLSKPASIIMMEGILIFNSHLLFVLIVIVLFVGWLLYNTIFFYEEFNNKFNSKFVHSRGLKIIWTTVPALILLVLSTPSFTLLYAMDEISEPELSLKILGHQWFWSVFQKTKVSRGCSAKIVSAYKSFFHKSIKKLIDQYLIFQYHICDTKSKVILPNKKVYFIFFVIATTFDIWWVMVIYICMMVFAVITVALGKLFPEAIGIPLTSFYKKHASTDIFEKYCGNPFSSIAGSFGKIVSSGGGRIAAATGMAILGQDALHKAGVGQYPKYQLEKWLNGGIHPSNEPFTFKDNGPSWGDNLSKGIRRE